MVKGLGLMVWGSKVCVLDLGLTVYGLRFKV